MGTPCIMCNLLSTQAAVISPQTMSTIAICIALLRNRAPQLLYFFHAVQDMLNRALDLQHRNVFALRTASSP